MRRKSLVASPCRRASSEPLDDHLESKSFCGPPSCDILGKIMPTVFTQSWFTDVFFAVFSLALSLFSAFEVSRRGWFRVRPVLSTYTWFFAIVSFLLLVVYLLQIPETIRYTACMAYSAIYYPIFTLICFFEIAVLYEFLFRMAGTSKTIQRTAVVGFIITISLTIIAALWMMNQSRSKTLLDAARFLIPTTSLALVASGVFVFAIKKARSLFLETRLSIFLAALALYSLVDLLSSFVLRRSQQISLVVGDAIWITVAILLYRALKSGPPFHQPH